VASKPHETNMEALFQQTWAYFFTFPTNMGLFYLPKMVASSSEKLV